MVDIKGYFDGRVIVLDEPARLTPGQRVKIQAETAADDPLQPGDSLRWLEENAINDSLLPNDLSKNHDHYLYGTPKKP